MKGIGESVMALQALTNGNLLMTIKRDVYFKHYRLAYEDRYNLNEAIDLQDSSSLNEGLAQYKPIVDACKVDNIVKTFECNITYDDFFSAIKKILVKGELISLNDSFTSAELWALFVSYKGEGDHITMNTQSNVLLAKAIPEDKWELFQPIYQEY